MELTSPALEDRELMRRVQQDDRAALAELFERHHRTVHGLLARYTGDLTRADDLVQETFLQVWRSRQRYQEQGSFRSWLVTVAMNKLRDAAQRDQRRRETPLEHDVPQDHRTPAELPQRVQQAVGALPESQRSVLLLVKYEGLSLAEAAAALETTPAQARGRLCRALETLRGKLGAKPT